MIRIEINYDAPFWSSPQARVRDEDIPPCPHPGHDVYVQGYDSIYAAKRGRGTDFRGFPNSKNLYRYDDATGAWVPAKDVG